jgi:hypothetical protein
MRAGILIKCGCGFEVEMSLYFRSRHHQRESVEGSVVGVLSRSGVGMNARNSTTGRAIQSGAYTGDGCLSARDRQRRPEVELH